MNDKRKSILIRAYLVYVLVLIFGILILVKIMILQWGQGQYWKGQAENLTYKYETIEARRGNIYAENECLLATSSKIYDIGMDVNPRIVPDSIFYGKEMDSLTDLLGQFFGVSGDDYKSRLLKARRNFARDSVSYVPIRKQVSYIQLKKIRKFPVFKLGRLRGGLVVDAREIRERPYGLLARRTIGYVKLARYDVTINLGKSGVSREKYDQNADTLSLCLFNLLHDISNKKGYRKALDASYAYHTPIRKQVDSRQLARLKDFPLIAEMDSVHGFDYEQVLREYKIGIEGTYDGILCGRDGTRLIQKIGGGAWKVVSDENLVEPKNGFDIHTAIDINLQDVTENALSKCLDSTRAQWGCAVLMEVSTGYIKAIANLGRDAEGMYYEKDNYAIRQTIEPGSTFKLASVIAVLEDGMNDTSVVVPTGTGPVGHRIVNDAHPPGYGYVSMKKAFEKSSNRGISYVTYKVFKKRTTAFYGYLEKLGLTEVAGVDLNGEPRPQMIIKEEDMETIPYGYGVKLTPVQVLAMYNAIANDGKMVSPRFVKSVGRAGEILYTAPVKVLKEQVCSQKTLKKVRKMLEGVVERGTATDLRRAACKVAGKTGTAKVYEDTGYVDKYVASFVGYFPADAPKYSCIVIIHGTSGTEYSGSQVSAPVFMEIADKVYASRLDLPAMERSGRTALGPPMAAVAAQKDLSVIYTALNYKAVSRDTGACWAGTDRHRDYVSIRPVIPDPKAMPDVRGMCVRDAMYLLEKRGFSVKTRGAGHVVAQSPGAGAAVKKGGAVMLTLSM